VPTDATDPIDAALARHRRAWERYDRTDRRRVMRAVNRMQALDDPAEAALAVMFARRQRRMWTRFWWVYPIIPAIIAAPRGWEAVLANLVMGGVIVAVLAGAFTWRAKRSADLNLAVVEAAQARKRSGSPRTRAAAPAAGKPRKGRRGGRR
jgi:hypothetical protein